MAESINLKDLFIVRRIERYNQILSKKKKCY